VGRVEQAEIERTLNMGVGMVAVVAPDHADATVALLTGRGVPAWVLGTIGSAPTDGRSAPGIVTLDGSHRA